MLYAIVITYKLANTVFSSVLMVIFYLEINEPYPDSKVQPPRSETLAMSNMKEI